MITAKECGEMTPGRIRRVMDLLGMGPEALGSVLGVSQKTVENWTTTRLGGEPRRKVKSAKAALAYLEDVAMHGKEYQKNRNKREKREGMIAGLTRGEPITISYGRGEQLRLFMGDAGDWAMYVKKADREGQPEGENELVANERLRKARGVRVP